MRGLDDLERRTLNDAVAEALKGLLGDVAPAAMPLDRLSDLARHGLAANHPEAAVPLALAAGIRHAHAFAVAEALTHFRAALAAIEASPSPTWAPTRLTIGRHLGHLLHFAGQPAEARPALLNAERLAEGLGDQAALAVVRSAIARVALALGQAQEAWLTAI